MYKICIDCTTVVMYGDMSGVSEGKYDMIERGLREMGHVYVNLDSDEYEGSWATCNLCQETDFMMYPVIELV